MSEILNSGKKSNSNATPQYEQRKIASSQSTTSNTDEIIERIKTIFSFYASFGDRMNINNLKSNKFHKMMVDASLEVGMEDKKSLDIIFCSHNKHKPNMSFEVFLDVIPDIAKFRYPKFSDDADSISKLIRENLLPLYDKCTTNNEGMNSEQADVSITFEQDTLDIVKGIESTLFEIFIVYFPWEAKSIENGASLGAQSSKAIFKFLSEYDICPTIINKTNAFQIYQNIMGSYSQLNSIITLKYRVGVSFTFPRFVD